MPAQPCSMTTAGKGPSPSGSSSRAVSRVGGLVPWPSRLGKETARLSACAAAPSSETSASTKPNQSFIPRPSRQFGMFYDNQGDGILLHPLQLLIGVGRQRDLAIDAIEDQRGGQGLGIDLDADRLALVGRDVEDGVDRLRLGDADARGRADGQRQA